MRPSRSSTHRNSVQECPLQISHGGSQGFKSPHLHPTTALVTGLAGHLRRAQRITGGLVSHWQAKARPADSSRRPAPGVTLTEAIPAVHWSVRRRIGAVRVGRLRASFGGVSSAAFLDRERGWLGGRQQEVAASSEAATPCLLAFRKLAGQESLVGSGVDRGRHLHLGRPGADHDQRHHQREYREDGRELEGGRDAVGQHLVGVLRRKLTGLLEPASGPSLRCFDS